MPIEPLNPDHFDPANPTFEALGKDNGFHHWSASAIAELLGYKSHTQEGFRKVIGRAMAACTTAGVPVPETIQEVRGDDGAVDWKLSRFGCYLVAMNGDPRKPQVAQAQAYFAGMAEAFRQYFQEAEGVERLLIRDEMSEGEKLLASTAKESGVDNYPFFHNAGYRGMYNMNFRELTQLRAIPKNRSPLDFMGRTELAANLFRITQTEEHLKRWSVRGQKAAERAATTVGNEVRKQMIRNSGVPPEDLPVQSDIKQVRSGIKRTAKELTKIDSPKQIRAPRKKKSDES